MAEVTGSIGSEQVELNNAATEATLRAMLAALNRQTNAIVNMSKSSGGSGGGANTQATQASTKATQQQTQATKEETAATNEATASMSKFAKGAMILGGIIGDLVGGVAKTASNLTDFAGGLMDGKGGLSDFYGSLKDLPLGLGIVAGLFQKIAQMQEAELETYRTMTKAGVNFGGQLNAIRQNALDLGLTLDQFGKLMADHGKDFANMGGSANDGAVAFTKVAKTLRDSKAGEELRALGYTSEETADKMANYITMTGGRTADQMKNTKGLAEASARYMVELDQLSSLTGESKEALEKQMQEQAADAAWQNYLQTLDEKGREKATKALQESLATGGKGAGDALKNKLAGIPLTEAGGMFMSMAQKANAAQDDQVRAVKDGTKGLDDVRKASAGMAVGLKKDSETIGRTTLSSLTQEGGARGELSNAMLKNENNLNNKKINSVEDYNKNMEHIAAEEKARSNSAAAAAAESEKAFKDMGAAIYGALQPALAMLTPMVNDLAQSFMEMVKNNMPAIKEALTTLVTFVTNFAKDLFSEEGRKKIINDIAYYMKLMLIEVKKAIIPWYTESDAKADKDKLDAEKKAYDAKAEVAREEMSNAGKIQALNDIKAGKTKESYDAEIKTSSEKIEALKKQKEDAGTDVEKIKKINKDIADAEAAQAESKRKQTNLVKLADKPEEQKAVAAKEQEIKTKKVDADKLVKESAPEHNDSKNEKQDNANWEKMGIADKIESGAARGIEKAGSMLGAILLSGGGILSNLGKTAKDDRIQGETDELARRDAEAKKKALDKRADGGPVKAGQPYWVGEEGPEIMVPDAAGKITPSDKTADLQPHLANMSKSISGNFKGVASDIAASGQQQQPITLSRESIAALGKLLPLDNMSGSQLPQLSKDGAAIDPNVKNYMALMTKDISANLGDVSNKMLDNKEKNKENLVSPETYQKLLDNISKIQPISDEAMKNMQMQSKAMLEVNKDNKEKNKENLASKENKVSDINSNQSKVQTDMFKSFTDTLLPGFINKLPGVGDLGKNQDETQKDSKSVMDIIIKSLDDKLKSVTSNMNNTANTVPGSDSKVVNENLLKEMQQLNKNTVELIKYTKMTLDENKNQTSKLGSLSGNLYV